MPRDDLSSPFASGMLFRAPPDLAQVQATLRRRRRIFAGLVATTVAALLAVFALVLAHDGVGWLDICLLGLLAFNLPWLVVGFWNGAIGFFVLVRDRGRLDRILPIAQPAADMAITARVAIVVPIHEEDPELVFRHLRATVASLRGTDSAEAFELFVLSDTRTDAIARREVELFTAWRGEIGIDFPLLHYRRRASNTGFKAGNIREFCETRGADFQFMVVLDADSVMSGSAILRCVRLMQANPDLGILQTLVVGMPAESAFARLFQFGMRHGMRTYTIGSAWWQGDCGPYWGHNAIVRLAPFIRHCRLPRLAGEPPLGGDVLSHDQLEAVLMRKAGWAVRVLPIEDGSWEATPPTLTDFVRRDLRWCHGNLQYLRLRLPGVHWMGRVQIALAILMYAGSPAWFAGLTLSTLGLVAGAGLMPSEAIAQAASAEIVSPAALGLGIFIAIVGMSLAPKLFGLVYALADVRQRRAFGGGGRLMAGAGAELVFSLLLAPVMSVAHTIFIAGLMARRRLQWRPQTRTGRSLSWAAAAARLWPQTSLGLIWATVLAARSPGLLPWAAPVLAGLILAVPSAVAGARPWFGNLLRRLGLCATPEECAPPPELTGVCPWLLADRRRSTQPATLFEFERG